MPFGVNSFKNPSKIGFNTKFDKSFEKDNEFNNDKGFKITKDPYKVDRLKRNYGASEVDFIITILCGLDGVEDTNYI